MTPTLTQELLARAQAKLRQVEGALQADPTNKWLAMAVQVARDKVDSMQTLLNEGGRKVGTRAEHPSGP